MARRTRTGLAPEILRPAAAPTDTYVRPSAPQLAQLADGLSQFAPALARFAGQRQEEKNAKDQLEGENFARDLQQAGKTYAQAIKEGLIRPDQSPFFRVGAYETFGRASAHTYVADLQKKLAESDVAESTDPADFEKFEHDTRKAWSAEYLGEKQDGYFKNAFGSQADALVNGVRANFAQAAGARLVRQTGDAFHAEVFSILEDAHTKKLDVAATGALINQAAARQKAAGMSLGTVNQLMSSAIDAAARSVNDTELLKVKHEVKLGTGTLAGTSYGAKGTEETENQIAVTNQTKLVWQRQEQDRKKVEVADGITSEMVGVLEKAASPITVDISSYIERMRKEGDPDKATQLLNIQKAFADKEYQDIPATKQQLVIGVHTGYTNMARLDRALAGKAITFSTYMTLASDVKERDKAAGGAGRAGASILDDDYVKDLRRRVRSAFISEYGESSTETRLRAEAADAEALDRYLAWKRTDAGKAATAEQANKWIHEEVNRQFGGKGSDPETMKDVPEPEFGGGPKPVDPKKQPAAPREVLQRIVSDNADGKLSPASLSVLKRLGVPPNKVQEFLDQQKQFLNP